MAKAVFFRHRDGQNMVARKTSVKAVVSDKPMSMTLTMPTALKASPDNQDDKAVGPDIAFFRDGRIEKPFVNILCYESAGAEQDGAGC